MTDDGATGNLDSRTPPLSRNRNYNTLWGSQFVSELATQICVVAFPLTVLAGAGSPLQMGAVPAVLAAATMLANLPAGLIADRCDRKKVMLLCQGVRALVMAALAVDLILGTYSFAHLVVVAVVEGCLGAVFEPAEHAALPQVVPGSQLSQAVARNTARRYLATLLGPALAGLLFAAHHMYPFLAAAVLLAASFAGLLFLRLPRQNLNAAPRRIALAGLFGGIRWVLGHRVIRTTVVWLVFGELFVSALIVIVLAASGEAGVAPGEVGLMMTCFGAGGLLGAGVAARLHAAVSSSMIIVGFSWIAAMLTAVMALVPAGVPAGIVFGGIAFLIPVTFTTIMTYQLITAPDELRGQLSGVVGLCAGGAGALGPLAGGVLMSGGSGVSSLLICAATWVAVAAGTTLSPTLRRFPTVRAEG